MEGSNLSRNVLQNRIHYDKIMSMENDKKITIFLHVQSISKFKGFAKKKVYFQKGVI